MYLTRLMMNPWGSWHIVALCVLNWFMWKVVGQIPAQDGTGSCERQSREILRLYRLTSVNVVLRSQGMRRVGNRGGAIKRESHVSNLDHSWDKKSFELGHLIEHRYINFRYIMAVDLQRVCVCVGGGGVLGTFYSMTNSFKSRMNILRQVSFLFVLFMPPFIFLHFRLFLYCNTWRSTSCGLYKRFAFCWVRNVFSILLIGTEFHHLQVILHLFNRLASKYLNSKPRWKN
jgi:hypothetical protein